MEPPETALEISFKDQAKRLKARSNAISIIHELEKGGYIAPHSSRDACWFLGDLFYKEGVEITTTKSRAVETYK